MSQTQFYTFSNSNLRFSVESKCISRMIDLTYRFLPLCRCSSIGSTMNQSRTMKFHARSGVWEWMSDCMTGVYRDLIKFHHCLRRYVSPYFNPLCTNCLLLTVVIHKVKNLFSDQTYQISWHALLSFHKDSHIWGLKLYIKDSTFFSCGQWRVGREGGERQRKWELKSNMLFAMGSKNSSLRH